MSRLADSMLYSPLKSPMSSLVPFFNDNALSIVLHLLAILAIAFLVNRGLRAAADRLITPASGQSRAEQLREEKSRRLSLTVYRIASSAVWLIAALTALPLLGISVLPALTVLGVMGLALGLGGQHVIRDLIAGFYIVWEDQF